MQSIVILGDRASKDELCKALSSCLKAGYTQPMVLASCEDNSGIGLDEVIEQARYNSSSNSDILFTTPELALNTELLKELNEKRSLESPNAIVYAPINITDENKLSRSVSLESKNLVQSISEHAYWPIAYLSIPQNTLRELSPSLKSEPNANQPDSSHLLVAKILIHALAQAEEIIALEQTVELTNSSKLTLTVEEQSQALSAILASHNIEELFPNLDWQRHSKESAALGYQNIAACFIKLKEIDKAYDCLNLSDSLEDSPRAMAMKGLIAEKRGATLEAVAQMVASLQQYESRKRDRLEHLVQFIPRNLKVINSDLHAGLAALNQRDNSQALKHFCSAVFHFDSFFEDSGL